VKGASEAAIRARRIVHALRDRLRSVAEDLGDAADILDVTLRNSTKLIAQAFTADIVWVADGDVKDIVYLGDEMLHILEDVRDALRIAVNRMRCPFREGDMYDNTCGWVYYELQKIIRMLYSIFRDVSYYFRKLISDLVARLW